jgi:hypothetical protein
VQGPARAYRLHLSVWQRIIMLLRLLLILSLAVSAAAAAQVPQNGTIDNLAYTPQSAKRLLFTGSYQGQSVRMTIDGLMATESFQGYNALKQVSDISAQVNSAPAGPGLSSQLERVWERFALLPLARADDNLLRGFFSDSASDARRFFGAPGHGARRLTRAKTEFLIWINELSDPYHYTA